jgi:hypothetical protein
MTEGGYLIIVIPQVSAGLYIWHSVYLLTQF